MSTNATAAFSTFTFGDPFVDQFIGGNSEFNGSDPPGYFASAMQNGYNRFVGLDSGTGQGLPIGGATVPGTLTSLLPASTSSNDKCAWWVLNIPALAGVVGCNPDGTYNGPGGSSPSGASTPAAGYNSVSGKSAAGFDSPQKLINNGAVLLLAVVLIGLGAWKVLS